MRITLSNFISVIGDEIEKIFSEELPVCDELKLVKTEQRIFSLLVVLGVINFFPAAPIRRLCEIPP